MLECVVNVSEGRSTTVLRALREATGAALLDLHCDADHNRSVFTLVGSDSQSTVEATSALARAVVEHVSIVGHSGVHPRFGVLDVVPFVALDRDDKGARAAAVTAARTFAKWWSAAFGVPVFFYDDADPEARDLPAARRTAFRERAPDLGPTVSHPVLGATAVGARRPLVAINCALDTADADVARDIARSVRGRDGGLPGVRALGFFLAAGQRAQVSMNVTDLERVGVEEACTRVRALADERGSRVTGVELVGLIPRAELGRCSAAFREWSGLDDTATIESRLRLP